MQIAVFDVGTRNFAMLIEKISGKDIDDLGDKYDKLLKKDKIVEGRPHCQKLKDMMNEFYVKGKTKKLELFDPNKGEACGLTNDTRRNLFEFLEDNKEELSRCTYIAIEEQFYNPKCGIINKPALMLAETCYTWLLLNTNADISYTPSKHKTSLLGCPKESMKVDKESGLRMLKKWDKSDRKKWSICVAKEIYTLRGRDDMVEYIEGRKGDDVSDCLLMCMAFILKNFVMIDK